MARLFPEQGSWSEAENLELTSNRLAEFSHGRLEVLPMPTQTHQLIEAFLFGRLKAFVDAGGLGCVLFAPMHARLWPGKCREPDVIFMLAVHAHRRGEQFWDAADLV